MHAVGIRELKNHLSEYVRRVRAGERLLVTDRGEVVAELRQPVDPAIEAEPYPELARRIREGAISAAAPNAPERYPRLEPVLPAGRVRELLDEERGAR
jgi:antitoxin (DNA-binding transcriptional repressor) of toxin-antitoxin stability system